MISKLVRSFLSVIDLLKKKILSAQPITQFLVILTPVLLISYNNCGKFKSVTSLQQSENSSQTSGGAYSIPLVIIKTKPLALSNNVAFSFDIETKLDSRLKVDSLVCQLDALAPVNCSNLKFDATFSDGDHKLTVALMDSMGQSAQTSFSFRTDSTKPSVQLSQVPTALTSSTTADFVFSGSDNLSPASQLVLECSLDSAPYTSCTSPKNLTLLSMGAHKFSIRVKDESGLVSDVVTHSWTVDSSVPMLQFSQAVPAIINKNTLSVTFSGVDDGKPITQFRCSLNGSTPVACTSPYTVSSLKEGNQTLSIQGIDTAGNLSAPLTAQVLVDTVAPPVPTSTFVSGSAQKEKSLSVSFSSTDTGSGILKYECSLDSTAFSSCSSPFTANALSDGSHTLSVRSQDKAMNVSAELKLTFVVDTVAPSHQLTGMPSNPSPSLTGQFVFSVSDNGSGLALTQCRIDQGVYSNCASPYSFTLAAGSHTFSLKSTDKAGNFTETSYNWMIQSATLDGVALYQAQCASCHNTLAQTTKANRTSDVIMAAIATIPSMNAIKLTPAEIDAIAKALVSTPTQAITPDLAAQKYFPSSETARSSKRIFRLTRKQIDLTAKYLFPGYALNSVNAFVAADPLQINYEFADILNFNSSNFPAYVKFVEHIVAKVRANPAALIDCSSQANSTACLNTKAREFITKAFRGDVTETKLAELATFYTQSYASVGAADAAADLVDVVLNSPQFNFRYEFDTDTGNNLLMPEQLQLITYTLADTTPDALKYSSATPANYVQNATTKQTTVDAILASPEARAKLMQFFISWLEVKEASEYNIAAANYPEFNATLAQEMTDEVRKFLNYHLTKAAPVLKDVTQSNASFVSKSLATIYGTDAAQSTGANLVNLSATERLGVFSLAGVVASHSGPTTTRLIKRGVFFARKVMCMELGATPPGVDTTLPTGNTMTERQKVEALTNQPKCLGCHSIINPLGFFQENYSATGKWRTTDNNLPIDSSLNFTQLDEGPIQTVGPVATLKEFTNSMMFKQCFVRQMFRFYMGRSETPSDEPLLRQMFLGFATGDKQDIVTLLRIMANSNRFVQR